MFRPTKMAYILSQRNRYCQILPNQLIMELLYFRYHYSDTETMDPRYTSYISVNKTFVCLSETDRTFSPADLKMFIKNYYKMSNAVKCTFFLSVEVDTSSPPNLSYRLELQTYHTECR